MKGSKILIAIVFVFFLAVFGTVPAKAEYVVGVKSEDWVKYDVQLGDEPVNPITHDYWTKITVKKVEGTVISGMLEEKSASGVSSQNFSIDFTKAHSSYALKDYYFIPANLTVGSVIPALNLTIQGMFINRFGRESVYTEVTGGSQQQGYWNISYSWDRNTGVLMNYYPSGTAIRLIDTNLWFVGIDWMFWTLVTIPIVIAVTIFLGLFVRHRRHMKRLAESYVNGPPATSKPEPSG